MAALGAGGMGEVYRARDSRLDRDVAIKILPAHLSSSPQFRERFEREAKAISQLNHPHICTLHDVGHENGTSYLVMELLEGESLADRLSKGGLPIEQVLRYGIEIAGALDRAHRQGIVHRDLKPANIMITKSGAKLLDFGLAKASEPPGGVFGPGAQAATEQKPLTQEGAIIGTFQYMAPEQLEGLPADARTDIFALGTVLYEMATGKRAFDGKTKTSLIAAIVSGEPAPISRVQPIAPHALEHVVAKCLEKDPDARWQSAHDIGQELDWIARSGGQAGTESRRRKSRAATWIAVGLAGALIGATASWFVTHKETPREPVARFRIALPADAPLNYGGASAVAISPDGTRLVYVARDSGGETDLYIRVIGQLAPVRLAGTHNGEGPTFSPDGRSIAFATRSSLLKLSLDGGVPVLLMPLKNGNLGTHWFGDTIYFNSGFTGGVLAIAADGGEPRQVIKTDPKAGLRAVVWPQMLPDGKTIIATVWNNGSWDDARIMAFPLDGSAPRILINGGSCAHYSPTGHLVFTRGGSLLAAPFDASKLAVTGSPVPVVNGVASGTSNGEAHYSFSTNGTLAYVPGGVQEVKRAIVWVDRKGKEQQVIPTLRPYNDPHLSPDHRSIAVTLETSTFDIWVLDIERDSISRISFGGDDSSAIWTSDGQRVIWESTRSGPTNLYWAAADGSSGEERLTTSNNDQSARQVSPDGRLLLASERTEGNGYDVVVLPLDGDHKSRPIVASRFREHGATFSPDGKWIVYISNETGRTEAYLRPFPGPGGKWQVSVNGADGAAFAHNGREIFYQDGSKFYVVPLELSPQVRVGRPQLMFEKTVRTWSDVGPDDQHLLMVRDMTPPTSSEMNIVLNWFDDLRTRVPAR